MKYDYEAIGRRALDYRGFVFRDGSGHAGTAQVYYMKHVMGDEGRTPTEGEPCRGLRWKMARGDCHGTSCSVPCLGCEDCREPDEPALGDADSGGGAGV